MAPERLADLGCRPARVAVIGGGRWARVITETLSLLLPEEVGISVHSPRGAGRTADWVAERGLRSRVQVTGQRPRLPSDGSTAVIVANAAQDHERTVEWALAAGAPVIVEKPMASTAAGAHRLARLADAGQCRLAAAHVFLFARYVDAFAARIAEVADVRSLTFDWMDPRSEIRYGELKQFAPGVPVFADWIPHVSSILGAVFPGSAQRCIGLEFKRGGAELGIGVEVGGVPCAVRLTRNGDARRRVLAANTSRGLMQLDFSTEPATIRVGSSTPEQVSGGIGSGPLASMLTAFVRWAGGGEFDRRLSVEVGLKACELIDRIAELYNPAQAEWLRARCVGSAELDADLRYALGELLQRESVLPSDVLEARMIELRREYIEASEGGS